MSQQRDWAGNLTILGSSAMLFGGSVLLLGPLELWTHRYDEWPYAFGLWLIITFGWGVGGAIGVSLGLGMCLSRRFEARMTRWLLRL